MKRTFTISLLVCLVFLRITAIAQSITTIAGGGVSTGVQATQVAIPYPTDVSFDAAGNQYVVCNSDGTVRKINTAGIITIVAGSGTATLTDGGLATAGPLANPSSVAVDASGNLYISEFNTNKIRKVSTAGIITSFAGTGVQGFSGDGGVAANAQLAFPCGLKFDAAGNLLFVDLLNNRIRKISTAGIITTIAGTGTAGYNGDGILATSAQLNFPQDLTVDGSGNIFIADASNQRVRKINTSGIISTVAGTGVAGFNGDGAPTTRQLNNPVGVAVDGSGALYIACGDHRIRYVPVSGSMLTPVFGGITGGVAGFSGDGGGSVLAQVNAPWSMATDAAGNLFVADENNHRIRKITAFPNWIINTTAGTGANNANGDGGPAAFAVLSNLQSIAVDRSGNVYFPDKNRVRKVTPAGLITTIAGTGIAGYSGDGGPATSAQLNNPFGVYVDLPGNVYISTIGDNRIRKINTLGVISTIAGTGTLGYSGDGGLATSAAIAAPQGMVADAAGNFYITDFYRGVVRKINTAGIISTVAGTGTQGYSGDGGPATSAMLSSPNGISIDAAGNLYVGDDFPNVVRKINTAGIISSVAGGNSSPGNSGDGGPAMAALFGDVESVTVDAQGNLFIVDAGNHRVRRVDAGTGTISAFAGTGTAGFSGDGGAAMAAQLKQPWAAALDTAGNLYIADAGNLRIRKVSIPYTLANTTITVNQIISGTYAANVDDNNYHRIATVIPTPGPNALNGNVSFKVGFDAGIQTYNGSPYVSRHYDVVPSTNAGAAQATLTLYFLQSEFDAYNNYVTANNLSVPRLPIGGVNNGSIVINQYHGLGTAPGNYSGGAVNMTPSVNWNSTNNWWEVSFPVNGFSGFYLSTANTPLPLTLLRFNATLQNKTVILSWATSGENNAKDFDVERSIDPSAGFSAVGTVAATNSATSNNYRFTDNNLPGGGTYFYRLKMKDRDGRYRYSNTVAVKTNGLQNDLLVYPNPATNRLNIQIQNDRSESVAIQIANMKGEIVQEQRVEINNGSTGFSVNTEALPAGSYLLICTGTSRTATHFVKK